MGAPACKSDGTSGPRRHVDLGDRTGSCRGAQIIGSPRLPHRSEERLNMTSVRQSPNPVYKLRQPPSWVHRLVEGLRCRSDGRPSSLRLRFGVARQLAARAVALCTSLDVLHGAQAAERRVRPHGVVVGVPVRGQSDSVPDARESVPVQQLVAHSAVEALGDRVLASAVSVAAHDESHYRVPSHFKKSSTWGYRWSRIVRSRASTSLVRRLSS